MRVMSLGQALDANHSHQTAESPPQPRPWPLKGFWVLLAPLTLSRGSYREEGRSLALDLTHLTDGQTEALAVTCPQVWPPNGGLPLASEGQALGTVGPP